MSFLHPLLFGAGAAAVGIPIIIHLLFRRRRKPVVWAAMRFLLEAYRQRRRRLRLEQLLLLAARCALIALIALALGRPIAQSASAALGLGGGRTVYLLIDNGLASSLRGDEPDAPIALDAHKAAAHAVLDALSPGDRAGLVTLANPASPIVVPASADRAALASLIDGIEPADAEPDFAGALAAVGREVRADEHPRATTSIVLLSEFRRGSADLARPLPAALEGVDRVRLSASKPATAPTGNVQILAVQPLRRVALARDAISAIDVRVHLRRTGSAVGEPGATTVRLALARTLEPAADGASAVVRWRRGQSEAEVVLSLASPAVEGAHTAALVARIDRDALDADNRYARPVQVREGLRVGVAARPRFGPLPGADALEPADWLRLALAPTDAAPIELSDVDPAAIDTPTLARLDALVLPRPDLLDETAWSRVAAFARAGGVVIVSPPAALNVHLWSDAMIEALGLPWRIAREPAQSPEGVHLSVEGARGGLFELIASELPALTRAVTVTRRLPIIEGADAAGSTPALSLETGEPWLTLATPGSRDAEGQTKTGSRGLVAYFASAAALSWTDLPARPLFVPLVQELVRQGVGVASGGGVFVAGTRPIAPSRAVELVRVDAEGGRDAGLTGSDGSGRVPVSAAGLTTEPLRRAGLWRALDAAGLERGLIAVNPDADAGRTGVQPADAVRSWLAGSGLDAGSIEWLDESAGVSGAALARAAQSSAGWSRWLLIAAAFVALAELVMARLFSHAPSAPSGAGAPA